MTIYKGNCHCGDVSYSVESPEPITKGLRCTCSLCSRKGAIMSTFTVAPDKLQLHCESDKLSEYQFGSLVAKHYFCKSCGIYPFHSTKSKPGYLRFNLACLEDVNLANLDLDIFDGAKI